MAIQFLCSKCGVQFSVGENLAGTMARCNNCGNVVQVPAARPTQHIPEARIEQVPPAAARAALPVARMEVVPSPVVGAQPAPAPITPQLRRPIYPVPKRRESSGSSPWL